MLSWHNEVRDLTVEALTEICKDVSVEPALTNFTVATFPIKSTTVDDTCDVVVREFWARDSDAFVSVRVLSHCPKVTGSNL